MADTFDEGIDALVADLQAKAAVAMAEVMTALTNWVKTEHGHPGVPHNTEPTKVVNGHRYNPPHDAEGGFWDLYGATNNSIRGEIEEVSAFLIRGVLTAGMDYDVWLELAHEGKWAFLWPTVMNHKAEIRRMIAERMKI